MKADEDFTATRTLFKLHQILSLKSLGFSFEEIKNKLTATDTPDEVAAALTEQSKTIQTQIDALFQSLQDIQRLKTEVLKMQSVDFKKYADIIVNLQMKIIGLSNTLTITRLIFCAKGLTKRADLPFCLSSALSRIKRLGTAMRALLPTANKGKILQKSFGRCSRNLRAGI